MKRLLVALGAVLMAATVAYAQSVKTFNNFIQGLPSASTPPASTDQFYILQNGTSKKVPFSSVSGGGGGGGGGGSFNSATATPTIISLQSPRSQIPNIVIGTGTFMVNGFLTTNDRGIGAIYTSQGAVCPNGINAILDAGGTCFNMVRDNVGGCNPTWFGSPVDDGATLISVVDIANNPQWKGIGNQNGVTTAYQNGMSWDYVGLQEATNCAFAPASTPGHIIWLSQTGGGPVPLYIPRGSYGINNTLFMSMTGGKIYTDGKNNTILDWTSSTMGTVWYCSFCSYSQFFGVGVNNGLSASWSSTGLGNLAQPATVFDSVGSLGALQTQQNSFYDYFCSVGALGQCFSLQPNTGNQGDTNQWFNPFFISTLAGDFALRTGNANSLDNAIFGGDFQGFSHDAIANFSGQVQAYNSHSENQWQDIFFTSPILSQFTTYGADLHYYSGVNGSGISMLFGWRAEDDILMAGVGSEGIAAGVDIRGAIITAVDTAGGWQAQYPFQKGVVVTSGTRGLAFMMVGANTDSHGWHNITGGSGTKTVQDANANYIPHEFQQATSGTAIYALNLRFSSNGNFNHCGISDNTTNTISFTNSVCSNLSSEKNYEVVPYGGTIAPVWDTITLGSQVNSYGTIQGFQLATGSSCVGVSSSFTGGVGDFIVVPYGDFINPQNGQPIFPMPLYAKVTGTGAGACSFAASASHLTIDRAAGLTVVNGPGYFGTPITDSGGVTGGNEQWINLSYDAIQAANVIDDVSINLGRVSGTPNIGRLLWVRPDWVDSKFQGAPSNNVAGFAFNTIQGNTLYANNRSPIPSCGANAATGTIAVVQDNNTTTYGAVYTTGGTTNSLVFCDGTNWRVH